MTATPLAHVDPAAAHDYSPDSHEARAMLAEIIATPRPAEVSAPRRSLVPRRPILALTVACTAAIVAVPVVAGNDHHPLASGAYAVTTTPDGSVKITVHWSQATDVAALQKALDAAHARTKVLTATEDRTPRIGDPLPPTRACAGIRPGTIEQPDEAVTWHSQKPISGVVIRPNLFPRNETLVLEVVFTRSTGAIADVSSTLAVAPLPTCISTN